MKPSQTDLTTPPTRTRRTTSTAVTTIAALTSLTLLAAAAPATAEEPPAPAPQAPAITEANTPEAAIAAAQSGHRRVEVLERRTESSTTWAAPDGHLVTELTSGPTRMLRNGNWVDVDATLTRRPDGSVAAKAHPQELRLAGGGGVRASSVAAAATAPDSANRDLVTLGMGSRRMAVQWKGGLPAPAVSGHKAVYQQAVPGADLVVDATRDGFEQFLVLKDRPAQDKAPWTVPLTLPGLDATQQDDGSVSFKDRKSGEEVGLMPAPVMWDAQTDPRSGEHTHSARVPMTLSQNGDTVELTLAPDPAFLSAEDTVYPVTIDPATDALGTLFDTFVQDGDTTDQSSSTDLKLGWPGDYADTAKTRKRIARSYMTWDTSVFADALVSSAKLSLYNYHSWSCEARPWEVWAANGADADTRWGNQPARTQKIATSTETRGASCKNAGWVSADVTSLAQTWASAKADEGHIALKAADESDTFAWKRFYSSESTAEQIPQLTVSYNYRPRTGTNLQAGPPFYSQGGIYRVNTTTPTLRFTPEDSNNDDQVRGTYQITDTATGKVVTSVVADPVPTGETSKVQVPAGKLTNGRTYSFRTTTDDGTHWANGWSDPVTFTVDTALRMTPELTSLSAVNTALDAADVTPATTSDSAYAAVAATGTTTVGVPWGTSDAISVKSAERGSMTMGLPTAVQPRGVALNGSVVYVSPDGPVDTVAQPTLEGGVRTFQVIKNATAPHEYTSAMKLPAGATLTPFDGGTVLVSSGTDENTVVHGLIDAPWARDADGKAVPTSYRVEGDKLVQTVDFSAATAFPVVVDPKLTFGLNIYFNATSVEWKAYSMAATTAGWGGWLYGCTVAKLPAKLAGIGKMVCGAAGLNAWKNLVNWLKQIKNWNLAAGGCYQIKLWGSSKLTKVSKKNCR
ncbi:DNRLRE domain-containing protein [Streptomyces roseirectus]|uniref:DNRLRE domain-containing protein n=1 Tax=Streptomyces roseirectus TaxID=2768066 RepID=A0A7H0IIK5_9ACTN|nr:DNRLRE domain-containing protein [Streptomyces roseirectus]QNP72621.1 DNRLRE domain-containing protein [Streptomyces roseirectus]